MKKYLLLLLTTVSIYGQTYPTNPTAFGKISINTNIESTTATKISVQEANNQINWLQPINIPIPIIPMNYAPTSATLGGHILGIDAKLGALTGTTAGISTRVWFTADQTTITAGTFDLTNPLNKGIIASHQQTVANDDGQKKYFTTDLIGQPFAMATLFPQGLYAGNLSVSTTPTNANQKFTVELYKCNNAGTPIASGVSGAVTGSLGVTVIMIMDSGEVTLANASVTNLPVSTILGSAFNIAVGERIRYHVSAEKVGTAGGVINESVYYGNSYNSFIDVPVIYNSTSIKDVSTVTSGVGTVTDALNTLNSSNLQKAYINSTSPQITTTAPLGAFTIKRGSASDTDNILVGQNGVGSSVFSIKGNGSILNTMSDIASPDAILNSRGLNPNGVSLVNISNDLNNISIGLGVKNSTSANDASFGAIGDVFIRSSSSSAGLSLSAASGSGYIRFLTSSGERGRLFSTGNWVLQSTGTFTDNGFRLDVQGTTRLGSTVTLQTTPTTSAGTYNILTINTSTGVFEKVASTAYATTASPTFTGTPLAPTATTGTNTTQIATTAFVQTVARPYKVYSALMLQSGTSAPTATVMENTYGGTITWTRLGTGLYQAPIPSYASKIVVLTQQANDATVNVVTIKASDNGSNGINLATIVSGAFTDGVLNCSVEIRMYP